LEPLITAHLDGYLSFHDTFLYQKYRKKFNLQNRQ